MGQDLAEFINDFFKELLPVNFFRAIYWYKHSYRELERERDRDMEDWVYKINRD